MKTTLLGEQILALRPAILSDRRWIFNSLVHSNLTAQMLGPPLFPDALVPTWEEFIEDYIVSYFSDEQPEMGRCFLILRDDKAIGQINYNPIHPTEKWIELDIWLADSKYTGKGYGRAAIQLLCQYLKQHLAPKSIILAPSARNVRAIRAYKKAGFQETTAIPKDFEADYDDTVILKLSMND